MAWTRVILPALLALLATACGGGGETPQLRPLEPGATVLAFGDSLTFGTGAARGQSYPAVLAGLTGLEVVNAGVPGETTRQGLARLPDALDAHAPRLVLLCLGGNDMLRRQDRGAMKANLEAMIQLIRGRGIEVVLLGVPEPALFGLESEGSYAELARRHGLPLQDRALAEILSDDARKADRIHPNAAGYADLAKAIALLLHEAGAIP